LGSLDPVSKRPPDKGENTELLQVPPAIGVSAVFWIKLEADKNLVDKLVRDARKVRMVY
jgi:hypothetical protein